MTGKIGKILGLNKGHDGGCTLLIDGEIAVNMSEERLTRVKYAYGWINSLKYCLEKTKTRLDEVDLVVFSDYSDKIRGDYDGRLSYFGFPKKRCIRADHHISHACSAFFTSPFDRSLVLVIDGRGNNNNTESVYIGEGNSITKVGGNPVANYEKGIVAAYQAFTSYFGWHQNEAGKTMGLSSYGNPNKFSNLSLFTETKEGMFYNNLEYHTADGVGEYFKRHKVIVPKKFSSQVLVYKDMAAWLQAEFERVVIGIINKFQKETGLKNLCMAGGGALNTVCNTKILEKTNIEKIHIFPAAGDPGQSVGNALYGYYIFAKNERRIRVWKQDYRKDSFSENEIQKMLKRISEVRDLVIPKSLPFRYRTIDNPAKIGAKLISQGKIIGWFQEGSEIGPRALGHRSILCDARPENMKDILNNRVKHREVFRPFAASVLREKISDYFETDMDSPFMLFVVPVKTEFKMKIPAVTHVDGTCRVQTVTKTDNGTYYDLISAYYKLTGVALILNTSYNLAGEPIVETPTDALRCFLSTKMDYLILVNFLVEKIK